MNLPNKLTVSRIILSPVFMVFLLVDGIEFGLVALVIFLIAAVTDILDGYVARRTGGLTSFGKFMDPLADKLLVSMALIGFLARGVSGLPGWMVVVIIAREMVITGFRSLAAYRGLVIASSRMARVKTVFQMVLVAWILCGLVFRGRLDWLREMVWAPGFAPSEAIRLTLLWSTVLLTAVSGLDYLFRNREVLWVALKNSQ